MKVEQNIARLIHLMKLYSISKQELLAIISEKLKNKITEEEVFGTNIKINHLKRIDKIFNKGLHYYLDPKAPISSPESSIFFRKTNFNSDLNIGAKKIVNKFEEFKISLTAIAKLSDINFQRHLPIIKSSADPKDIATNLRRKIKPIHNADQKEFLKSLINKFAEYNILIFEFVETWNKKEKANIDGFFLKPNVIVLKRQQKAFRREIFTLVHEIAHYLLNEEEIEAVEDSFVDKQFLSKTEKWCNDFSYSFLINDHENELHRISNINEDNDYELGKIREISRKTHLSPIALYTRLLITKRISPKEYRKAKNRLDFLFRRQQERLEAKKEINKELGVKSRGFTPKPINSPLLLNTIQVAFHSGIINEHEACKKLNIDPKKLGDMLG